MHRVPLAAAAAAVLAAATPAAATHGFAGSCSIEAATNDVTPMSALGGHQQFYGAVSLAGRATLNGAPAPTAPVHAECRVYVDGVHDVTLLATAGVGAVAAVAPMTFTLRAGNYQLCTYVLVAGHRAPLTCWPI